jgi:hypothetical protein
MKRGYKIALVAIIAIATNFGLHAAFGWGGQAHCGNHYPGHGPQGGGCGPHQYYQHHQDCSGGHGNCANPYNHEQHNNNPSPADTVTHP